MAEYRGVRPTDLRNLAIRWQPYGLLERITDAKMHRVYSEQEQQAAVAISLNEQPRQALNGNCIGLMCWKHSKPWGWTVAALAGAHVIGFTECGEGQTLRIGFFLAFESPDESIAVMLHFVRSRGLTTPEAYADKWVSPDSVAARAVAISGFKSAMRAVVANWGAGMSRAHASPGRAT